MPLRPNVLDVGVFSLSLMGTNFPDFLREANRVLKRGGKLFVAEVLSRFPEGGDCKDFLSFAKEEAGFRSLKVAKLKDFFYIMVFEKEIDAKKLSPASAEFSEALKPCLYKKR